MKNGQVLVVEDDDNIRALLVDFLRHVPLSVDAARDGVEALHRISTSRYAVVVLDVMMPKMSGVDFLDSMKALSSDPSLARFDSVPAVIVVTGASELAVPANVLQHRLPDAVKAVFRKPVDVAELARCVSTYALTDN